MSKYKEDIIRLRKQKRSYDYINEELGCSKGVISYHCKKEGLEDVGLNGGTKELSDEKKKAVRETYKEKTKSETANIHDVSKGTVQKYGGRKKKKKTKTVGSTQHTKDKGDITELKIATRLAEIGYTVLEPYGENDRYDFVFEDENGDFQRVQCKTPKYKKEKGVLSVRTCSSCAGETYTYHGQIEYFATYSEKTEKCYLIPFDEVENCYHTFNLRIKEPKNEVECRMAEDFVL